MSRERKQRERERKKKNRENRERRERCNNKWNAWETFFRTFFMKGGDTVWCVTLLLCPLFVSSNSFSVLLFGKRDRKKVREKGREKEKKKERRRRIFALFIKCKERRFQSSCNLISVCVWTQFFFLHSCEFNKTSLTLSLNCCIQFSSSLSLSLLHSHSHEFYLAQFPFFSFSVSCVQERRDRRRVLSLLISRILYPFWQCLIFFLSFSFFPRHFFLSLMHSLFQFKSRSIYEMVLSLFWSLFRWDIFMNGKWKGKKKKRKWMRGGHYFPSSLFPSLSLSIMTDSLRTLARLFLVIFELDWRAIFWHENGKKIKVHSSLTSFNDSSSITLSLLLFLWEEMLRVSHFFPLSPFRIFVLSFSPSPFHATIDGVFFLFFSPFLFFPFPLRFLFLFSLHFFFRRNKKVSFFPSFHHYIHRIFSSLSFISFPPFLFLSSSKPHSSFSFFFLVWFHSRTFSKNEKKMRWEKERRNIDCLIWSSLSGTQTLETLSFPWRVIPSLFLSLTRYEMIQQQVQSTL